MTVFVFELVLGNESFVVVLSSDLITLIDFCVRFLDHDVLPRSILYIRF